jgi:hypothetical protein
MMNVQQDKCGAPVLYWEIQYRYLTDRQRKATNRVQIRTGYPPNTTTSNCFWCHGCVHTQKRKKQSNNAQERLEKCVSESHEKQSVTSHRMSSKQMH